MSPVPDKPVVGCEDDFGIPPPNISSAAADSIRYKINDGSDGCCTSFNASFTNIWHIP